ncbi:inositol phosphophingolipids phospholipase C [Mycena crocata]|nr:inositol phosphophingolipids phospholipase C [Mycena crocata]
MSSDCIRVFSLNCWGLKYVSKNRVQRMSAIAAFLLASPYDIVCLQELFISEDFETIRASLSDHLSFAKLFNGGAIGKGLAIFSRFPIVAATSQPYSLNGSPLDLKGADWFAGKAATSVLIIHPMLGEVQVFNTHFFSEGGDDGPECNRAHRLVNAWEFAKLVKQAAARGRYVIAAGDFNSMPFTLPMTVVLNHGGLGDAWASLHNPLQPSRLQGEFLTPADAISLRGVTYDSPLNSYAAKGQLGKRIDYILFRNPVHPYSPASVANPRLLPMKAHVALTDLVTGHSFSYSDHFGVEVTFRIEHREATQDSLPADVAGPGSVVANEPPDISREQLSTMLDALKTHLGNSTRRAQRELRISIGCAVFLLCLIVGTAWSPKAYLAPVFILLGAMVTSLGATMLYVGFLYGGWEASTLHNVIEEIELYAEGNICI